MSSNGMIIKLLIGGAWLEGDVQIVHIRPCLKPHYCRTTLVKPNFSGMLVALPNIENNMTLSAL